jgi:hypothetical protein
MNANENQPYLDHSPNDFDVTAFANKLITVENTAIMEFRRPQCDDPNFIVYLLPSKYLLRCDSIPRHESIAAELIPIAAGSLSESPLRHRLIFVSHRWDNGHPDSPDNMQLKYIQKALKKFQYAEDMYIWIDYSCMKQDAADLPTIRRLNYILSHATFFMLVLPDFDNLGHGYVKRVWCIYEWLACIHWTKIIIVSNASIVQQMLASTMHTFAGLIDPRILQYMDHTRIACGSYLHIMFDHFNGCSTPPNAIDELKFIANLEAFKEEDKLYVYENMCSMFSLVDMLFLFTMASGDGISGGMIIDTASVSDGGLMCNFEAGLGGMGDGGGGERRSSLSSLGLGENWRDELYSSSDDDGDNDEHAMRSNHKSTPLQDSHDVSSGLLSSSSIHHNVICDACHIQPILGVRYTRCIEVNYDLCEGCEDSYTDRTYPFVKIYAAKDYPAVFTLLCHFLREEELERAFESVLDKTCRECGCELLQHATKCCSAGCSSSTRGGDDNCCKCDRVVYKCVVRPDYYMCDSCESAMSPHPPFPTIKKYIT